MFLVTYDRTSSYVLTTVLVLLKKLKKYKTLKSSWGEKAKTYGII